MSKVARELYEKLKAMSAGKGNILPAVVTQVNKEARTIDVEFDDMEIGDVRLQATAIENQKGNVLFPKTGSIVLIERIGTGNEFFITMYSELEECLIEIDNTTLKTNASGVMVQRGDNNLKTVLNDFMNNSKKVIDEINKIVVAIGNSPDVAALTVIKTSMEENKNKLNQILQ